MKTSVKIILAAIALLFTANTIAMAQNVPPVGPSGPTGWCTDSKGRNFRC